MSNNPFLQHPPPVFARGQWEYNYLGIPNYLQQAQQQASPLRPMSNPISGQDLSNVGNSYAAQYPDPGNPFVDPRSPYIDPGSSTAANVGTETSSKYFQRSQAPSPSPSIASASTTATSKSDFSSCTVWPTQERAKTGLGLNLGNPPAGHRHQPNLPRGVYISSGEGGVQWQLAIETIIQYKFGNADLLEEALESPDSGVTCVGDSHRHLGRDGNKGLAAVGTKVVELVLMGEAYAKKMSEEESKKSIERLTNRVNFDRIGTVSKIERFVRRRKSEVKRNTQVLRMLKEDVQFEDPTRTVARAMRAIMGAVYYDGGLDGVKKVMKEFGLQIK